MLCDLMEDLVQAMTWGQWVNRIQCPVDRVHPCDMLTPAPGKYPFNSCWQKNIGRAIHNTVTVLRDLENEPGKTHSLSGGQGK